MISGSSKETDDYYGYNSTLTPSGKRIRRMRRTQLSNQKKSNHSLKNLSSQKNSSISNLKSKQSANYNQSNLRSSAVQSSRNSGLKNSYLPNSSSTDFRDNNSNGARSSYRKSRLQISTGVVGIKMGSLSPSPFTSQPSKVVFVNESSSNKKGSRIKKQKSILYVEYNNFMNQMNSNNNQSSRVSSSRGKSKQKSFLKQSSNIKKRERKQQKQRKQQVPAAAVIENEYYFGSKRQTLTKNTQQKIKNEIKNMLNDFDNQSQFQTPTKNQTSIANLSVSSNKNRNKITSIQESQKSSKVQTIQSQKKVSKTKISKQQLTYLKQNKNKPPEQNYYQKHTVIPKVQKINKLVVQNNVIQNDYNLSSNKITGLNLSPRIKHQYFQKPISSNSLGSESRKTLNFTASSNQREFKTQKQIDKVIIRNQQNKRENIIIQNPYSLTKNEELVIQYNKKKINNSQTDSQVSAIKKINNQNQIVHEQSQSDVSNSVISISSSKRGRKLLKSSSNSKKGSKISINSPKSKLRLNIQDKKIQPKTHQPYSNYKRTEIQTPQINHNQDQTNQIQKIKKVNDYNPNYYTPNPHRKIYQKQTSQNLNSVDQSESSMAGSEVYQEQSSLQNFEMESLVSQQSLMEDNKTVRSSKKSNLSRSRLKRQQIYKKSKLRQSILSDKSSKVQMAKISKAQKIQDSVKKPDQRGSMNKNSISNSQVKDSLVQSRKTVFPTDFEKLSNSKGQNKIKQNHQIIKKQTVSSKVVHPVQKLIKDNIRQQKMIQSQGRASLLQTKSSKQITTLKIVLDKLTQSQLKQSKLQMQKQSQKQYSSDQQSQSQSQINLQQSRKELKFSKGQSQLQLSNKIEIKSQLKNITLVKQYSVVKQDLISKKQILLKQQAKKKQQAIFTQRPQIKQTNLSKQASAMKQINLKKQQTINNLEKSIKNTPHKLTQSNVRKDSDSLSSKDQTRKSVKFIKKIFNRSNPNSQSSIAVSKLHKSILSAKSGRNLKPFSLENPTIDQFLQYLDEYQISVGFLYLYTQNTTQFYCQQDQSQLQGKNQKKTAEWKKQLKNKKSKQYEQKYQKITFLMMKKFLYQKNRIIKCLRGLQQNIFNLTGLQIPNKILKKFINHQKTKQKLKQFQQQTKQLFKQLEQQYRSLRLKADNKKDKLIKLQSPYDNFTRDIVTNLLDELNQITAEIDNLQDETSSQISQNPSISLKKSINAHPAQQSLTSVIAQEIFSNQQRCVQIMQIVFLLSQLQNRKVKKLQLINISDIDFESYYENYIERLLETYQFFQSIKYPSDQQQSVKK